MADEAHTPNHRWYQRQYNVSLAPNMVSRDIILAAGIALIDAASITPANLFAAGEPGVWYDPSDLTTLFQDSAGTTPVTAAGQPVGRMLDKSGRGNHATQSTAASRPIYAVMPKTGIRNLLTYTSFEGAVAGTPGTFPTSFPSNATTGSIVSVSGDTIVFSSNGGREICGAAQSVAANATETWSVYITENSGLQLYQLFAAINATGATISQYANGVLVSPTYVPVAGDRLSIVLVNGATAISPTFRIGVGVSGAATGQAGFKNPQRELGSVATAYQKVVSKYDVTEAGVQSLSYLSFDGVDDFLVTPTITPSTDKVQVFTGVQKATDLVTGIIAEMSANSATNTGCFAVWGNTGTGYTVRSKGSLSTSASGGSTAAPVLDVLTAIGDIAAPLAKLRLDGTDVGQSTATQGTGNFSAYPIYIGNRSDGTLPFNGRLYGLVTRFGANLDAEMISRMEAWMNGKTGAY